MSGPEAWLGRRAARLKKQSGRQVALSFLTPRLSAACAWIAVRNSLSVWGLARVEDDVGSRGLGVSKARGLVVGAWTGRRYVRCSL